MIPNIKQRGFRAINEAIDKSSIMLSKYWKNQQMNYFAFWGHQYYFRRLYVSVNHCIVGMDKINY